MSEADAAHMGTNPVTGQGYDFPGLDPNQPNGHLTILGSPRSGRSTTAALRILRRKPLGHRRHHHRRRRQPQPAGTKPGRDHAATRTDRPGPQSLRLGPRRQQRRDRS